MSMTQTGGSESWSVRAKAELKERSEPIAHFEQRNKLETVEAFAKELTSAPKIACIRAIHKLGYALGLREAKEPVAQFFAEGGGRPIP